MQRHCARVRRAPSIVLSQSQRSQLQAWCRGRSTPFRIVIRSWIVLLAASGKSDREICRILRTNPITVARWRARYALFGTEGIRTEAPHAGSPPPVSEAVTRRIIHQTLRGSAADGRRWSSRALAREMGVSHTSVQRIWKKHGLSPDRSRTLHLALDPRFRPLQLDLSGVYVNPPHRVVVLAFARLPYRAGASSRSPYARPDRRPQHAGPWILDLMGALDLLEQHEISHRSRRYLDAELLSFIRAVYERNKTKERIVLFVVSDAAILPPTIARWLGRHPNTSAELSSEVGAWKRRILQSARSGSRSNSTAMAPVGLPEFLAAVVRWQRRGQGGYRPFAWIEERSARAF